MKNELMGEFRTFEDLDVYQVAREFRKVMYSVTRRLPDFEKFDLRTKSGARRFPSRTTLLKAMGVIITSTNCASFCRPALVGRAHR